MALNLLRGADVLTDSELAQWCESALGSAPTLVVFRAGHLSQVVGVELASGQRVVVKARPFEERIAGCVVVQAELARTGFPCPEPLAGPARLGDLAITAETLIEGGELLSPAGGAAPFAALLARLVKAAPPVASVPDLSPSPPWTAWDHPGSWLWPDRDDLGGDLNQFAGPAWIDGAARLVRDQMRGCSGPRLVGHGDWMSQNLSWRDGQPLAVHDWDSVIAQPEVAIAGIAAAVWPAAGAPDESATPAQTAEFLAAYQDAADARWAERDREMAWAAGLWTRLFDAKKDAADGGGPMLDRLAGEIDERLARAGLRRP
jgi:Phosphotransferase enzyme family